MKLHSKTLISYALYETDVGTFKVTKDGSMFRWVHDSMWERMEESDSYYEDLKAMVKSKQA